jgi:hypothetical protein
LVQAGEQADSEGGALVQAGEQADSEGGTLVQAGEQADSDRLFEALDQSSEDEDGGEGKVGDAPATAREGVGSVDEERR